MLSAGDHAEAVPGDEGGGLKGGHEEWWRVEEERGKGVMQGTFRCRWIAYQI